MINKVNELILALKKELTITVGIWMSIFLFILFFKAHWSEGFNFNNKLLFLAGLATIVFLIIVLVRIIIPKIFTGLTERKAETTFISFSEGFLIVSLNSVAFAFYLNYVGFVEITFHIMINIIIINLLPVVVLRIKDKYTLLNNRISELKQENENLRVQLSQYHNTENNQSIRLTSETGPEDIHILLSDLMVIRSSDNYVEIMLMADDVINRHLIRNTLKSVEQQLSPYKNFVRCHRTSIVNINFFKELKRVDGNYELILSGFNEPIPVSRQYLLKIREMI